MMTIRRGLIVAVALFVSSACAAPRPQAVPAGPRPLIIAHRGASGHLPEHTLAAYALAIEMGADFIEPDVVITRDSVLIARHEHELGETTDVSTRFPGRRTTKQIDGIAVSGWFSEDFTFAEMRTLRAKERLPSRSHARDGVELIPTLAEVFALVARESRARGRTIGVYPETKHPTYFRSIGLPLEEPLLAELANHGWTSREAPVFIQSFEAASLQLLRPRSSIRLVQLVPASGVARLTPANLAAMRRYADAIGVEKSLVQPIGPNGAFGTPTSLVEDAHRAGLAVHVWTLRSDAQYLPGAYRGDPRAEWIRFASLGVDGMFGDFPDVGYSALVTGPGALQR